MSLPPLETSTDNHAPEHLNMKQKTLSFDYEFIKNDFKNKGTFEIRIDAELEKNKDVLLTFGVFSQGREIGTIDGIFFTTSDGKNIFTSKTVQNQDVDGGFIRPIKKEAAHIPFIVQETIAQLLIHQIIHVWHSSLDLNQGSKRMYEALLKDPRLTGVYGRNSAGHRVYILQKAER